MKFFSSLFLSLFFILVATVATGKNLPKIAVWDLTAGNINPSYAQDLTSILVSEISKLEKYEVYSQENVRTLAGWTAERMTLGCTDTKCLTVLGQMDIAKLISGRVGKIGNTYSISLHLFNTQNVRAENSISEECKSEDELIPLVRQVVRKLLGVESVSSREPSLEEEWKRATPISFKDLYTGMEFIFVKGGCFEMGDTFGDGDPLEKPIHEVCVDDFYLGKYEVTVGEFKKFVDATGYRTEAEKGDGCAIFTGEKHGMDRSAIWRSPGFSIDDRHPVVCITWNDAAAFARWMEGRGGKAYRLPTEAEWEYAARSGGKKEKFSGTSQEDELGQYGWYGSNSGAETHPVGQKKPNGLDLYDMSGNVWEWCADWFDKWEYYRVRSNNNPRGPGSGEMRMLRGGSWISGPGDVRASNRIGSYPASRSIHFGFRLGLSAQ